MQNDDANYHKTTDSIRQQTGLGIHALRITKIQIIRNHHWDVF